jgi:hypothetical protein
MGFFRNRETVEASGYRLRDTGNRGMIDPDRPAKYVAGRERVNGSEEHPIKSRIAISVATAVLLVPGAAFASQPQSIGSQVSPGTGNTPSALQGPGAGVENQTVAGDVQPAGATAPKTVNQTQDSGASPSSLPFTGLAVGGLALLGAALLATGVFLRRREVLS